MSTAAERHEAFVKHIRTRPPHTESGTAPAGRVTLEGCSSAGGGSAIVDATVQLEGGEERDFLVTTLYGVTEDDVEWDRIDGWFVFEYEDEDGEDPAQVDLPAAENELVKAAAEAYNRLQPKGHPWTYVSEGQS